MSIFFTCLNVDWYEIYCYQLHCLLALDILFLHFYGDDLSLYFQDEPRLHLVRHQHHGDSLDADFYGLNAVFDGVNADLHASNSCYDGLNDDFDGQEADFDGLNADY